MIGLVLLARVLGLFEGLELKTLDTFLRLRPAEPKDERILIVGINESDIQTVGAYPIPDGVKAELLETLSAENPRAIGLDIIRDLPVEPGREKLKESLGTLPNIIGIERISSDRVSAHTLPTEQVGFIDFPVDKDQYIRRTYLGASPPGDHPEADRFRFSFALLLAELYLEEEGFSLENGRKDPRNMRFGDAELFSSQPNSGGYVDVAPGGVQVLFNGRSGSVPFEVVSLDDVLAGRVDKDLIENRIVLVGVTSLNVKDILNVNSVRSSRSGWIYGVEMHAHIVSQILSTVLDNRPWLKTWPELWEYIFIVIAGGLGMLTPRLLEKPILYVLSTSLIGFILVGSSFLMLLIGGWWFPIIPSLVVSVGILPIFYLYDRALRTRIDERQRVIEQTYDAIHSGPLQTLALILQRQESLDSPTVKQLEDLNRELRHIYNRLLKESLPQETQLWLGDRHVVDLRSPFHEVLHEVYIETLKRDFPGFKTITLKVVRFEPLQVENLSVNEKQGLCRFLEEALCNVGKHATGTTRLTVSCLATASENMIRVEDNSSLSSLEERRMKRSAHNSGRGTQQAQLLARKLRANFRRIDLKPGIRCEFLWPLQTENR